MVMTGPVVPMERPEGEEPSPQEQAEEQPRAEEASPQEQAEEQPRVEEAEEPPERQQINEYLDLGYSLQQLLDMGFARSTARQEWAKRQVPEDKANGKLQRREAGALAMTMKEKETIVPEWLAGQVMTLYDGDKRTAQVFMAGMSIPLLGIRLFAEAMKPFGDLLKLWQAGQADAARAVQGSGEEIAAKAAHEAAMGVAGYFEERKPWLAAAPDPFKAMFADLMRPMLENAMKSFTPQAEGQQGAPPGFTYRKEAQNG